MIEGVGPSWSMVRYRLLVTPSTATAKLSSDERRFNFFVQSPRAHVTGREIFAISGYHSNTPIPSLNIDQIFIS